MADDHLRRTERDAQAAPRDEVARTRLATARVRAGETPPAFRALESLEHAARGLPEVGARLAALAELSWARLRLGEPDRALELACEVAAGPPLPARAQPDLAITSLCRAGATFCRAGEEDRGLDLLSRAGGALAEVDEPWGELGSVHAALLRAFDDSGAHEPLRALPCVEQTVGALVRLGQDHLGDPGLVALLGRLGLLERAAARLTADLDEPHLGPWLRASGVHALAALGALGARPAAAMVATTEIVIARSGEPDDALTPHGIAATALSLGALGLDPKEHFERWGRTLGGDRLEEALLLHALLPGVPDLARLEHLLEQVLRIEATPSRTRVLRALISRGVELPAPDPGRTRSFLDRALLLAPTTPRERAAVLRAALRVEVVLPKANVRMELLTRRLARELSEPAPNGEPRWLLLEPLAQAAEHLAAGRRRSGVEKIGRAHV